MRPSLVCMEEAVSGRLGLTGDILHVICSDPHSLVIEKVPDGRMMQTGHFVHDYLGKPDMNMAWIAKGFGVEAEVARSPAELRAALARARRSTLEGKPYLIDAQTARVGVAWTDRPGFRRPADLEAAARGRQRRVRIQCVLMKTDS